MLARKDTYTPKQAINVMVEARPLLRSSSGRVKTISIFGTMRRIAASKASASELAAILFGEAMRKLVKRSRESGAWSLDQKVLMQALRAVAACAVVVVGDQGECDKQQTKYLMPEKVIGRG